MVRGFELNYTVLDKIDKTTEHWTMKDIITLLKLHVLPDISED